MSIKVQRVASTPCLPETGFIRLPAVLAVFPVSRATWYAGIRTSKYPKGYKLSPKTTAWKVEDIKALLTQVSSS